MSTHSTRRCGRAAKAVTGLAAIACLAQNPPTPASPRDPWPRAGPAVLHADVLRYFCNPRPVVLQPVIGSSDEAVVIGSIGQPGGPTEPRDWLCSIDRDGRLGARIEMPRGYEISHETPAGAGALFARPRVGNHRPLWAVAGTGDGFSVFEIDSTRGPRELFFARDADWLSIREDGTLIDVGEDSFWRLRIDGSVVWRVPHGNPFEPTDLSWSGALFFPVPDGVMIVDDAGQRRSVRLPEGGSPFKSDAGRDRVVLLNEEGRIDAIGRDGAVRRLGSMGTKAPGPRSGAVVGDTSPPNVSVHGDSAAFALGETLALFDLGRDALLGTYRTGCPGGYALNRALDWVVSPESRTPRLLALASSDAGLSAVALLEGGSARPAWCIEGGLDAAFSTDGSAVVTVEAGGGAVLSSRLVRVSASGEQRTIASATEGRFRLDRAGGRLWAVLDSHVIPVEPNGQLGDSLVPGACGDVRPNVGRVAQTFEAIVQSGTYVAQRETAKALMQELDLRGDASYRARAAWLKAQRIIRMFQLFGYGYALRELERARDAANAAGDSILAARASEGVEAARAYEQLFVARVSEGQPIPPRALDDLREFVRRHPRSPLGDQVRLRIAVLSALAASRDPRPEMRRWLTDTVTSEPLSLAPMLLLAYTTRGWTVWPTPSGDRRSVANRAGRVLRGVFSRGERPVDVAARERMSVLEAWEATLGLSQTSDGRAALEAGDRSSLAAANSEMLLLLFEPERPPGSATP